jgi:hypothetical protein
MNIKIRIFFYNSTVKYATFPQGEKRTLKLCKSHLSSKEIVPLDKTSASNQETYFVKTDILADPQTDSGSC